MSVLFAGTPVSLEFNTFVLLLWYRPARLLSYLTYLWDVNSHRQPPCQLYTTPHLKLINFVFYPLYSLHWAYISECHSHPLGFFVAFANIQHQVSLSSVTSPSAGSREFPKSHSSGEVDLDWSVVFRCTCARKREYVHALRAIPARG